MPASFIKFPHLPPCRAAAALCLAAALAACAGEQRDGAQYYSESAAMSGGVYQMNSPAVAAIAAPAARGKMKGQPSPQALAQAASLTLQRHYKYFLLIGGRRNKWAGLPTFGLSMGRDPYSFRDGGRDYMDNDTGFGIGADAPAFSFSGRDHGAGVQPARWFVYMLNAPTAQAVKALTIDKARLGNAVSVYDAGSPDAPPVTIRLK